MKNLDAYHDGLLAKHNEAYEHSLPWEVDCADDGDGYIVIDDSGESDGEWYETEDEAQAAADKLNAQAMQGDGDDFYIE
jgi:hypothetical protein